MKSLWNLWSCEFHLWLLKYFLRPTKAYEGSTHIFQPIRLTVLKCRWVRIHQVFRKVRTLGEILVVWRRLDVPRTPLATVYAEAELLNEDFGYGSDAMSCSVPVTVKEGSYFKKSLLFCFWLTHSTSCDWDIWDSARTLSGLVLISWPWGENTPTRSLKRGCGMWVLVFWRDT